MGFRIVLSLERASEVAVDPNIVWLDSPPLTLSTPEPALVGLQEKMQEAESALAVMGAELEAHRQARAELEQRVIGLIQAVAR